MNDRIESLDWLRGLMAFSIMIYHYCVWGIGPKGSETVLGRLGIYGVSAFFILSGLSLAIVYNKKLATKNEILSFYTKRLFRILPLIWIAITITLLVDYGLAVDKFPPLSEIIMNYTATFGFFKPRAYFSPGLWSIGNEMVFYALIPVFIWTYNQKKIWGNVLTIITIIIGIIFANFILRSDVNLSKQWAEYINPFNQLFLFALGISIFYNFKDIAINNTIQTVLLALSILIFCFLPTQGNLIILVTGINRLIFSLICFCIVLIFFKTRLRLHKYLQYILNKIGIATYSIYLLHPLTYKIVYKLCKKAHIINPYFIIGISMIITVVISFFVYSYYEEPFVKLGKYFLSRKKRLVERSNLVGFKKIV